MNNYNDIIDYNDYEDMDIKVINFIKMINNKESSKIPKPTNYTISTQSAMCSFSNNNMIDLSKIVVYISKNIIKNIILGNNPNYLITGINIDNIIIRFDESYMKKYKKPYISYMNTVIDHNYIEDVLQILSTIDLLENNSLKKHGRQKDKKDNEYFYNSCSIIVKPSINEKCVNIKLFNNGKITLTGCKKELDGYYASCILLEELKKIPSIFMSLNENEVNELKIVDYKITMINSDFNTNFKIDLIKLLNILNIKEKELFIKFNPEKYRGLIIGYFWNTSKKIQDGKCNCISKCNGKGNGEGDGNCKKITISIFKSGSIIITGGRLVQQIEDAYRNINTILRDNFYDIIKLSIIDFINDEENNNETNSKEHVKKDILNSKNNNLSLKKIKIKKIK